jgi:hypothetical protein
MFFLVAQLAQHAPHHLVGRLGERLASPCPRDRFGEFGRLHRLAQLEAVKVGDDDLGFAQLGSSR